MRLNTHNYFIQTAILLKICVCAVLLVACSDNDDTPQAEANSRSVLVFIAAQNNLQNNLNSDIEEMLAGVKSLEKNDRLVIFIDDTNISRVYEINSTTTAVNLNSMVPVYRFDSNLDTGSPVTLNKVLDYFFQHYPASDYGLVMWSHGSGWINGTSKKSNVAPRQRRAFGVDYGQGTSTRLNITDMAEVLQQYPKFEFILFDACFMQSVEVAYELREEAKYIIGSPAEIPSAGAPYKLIMPAMFKRDFSPQLMVDKYADYYNFNTNTAGVVISAIKTDEFDRFITTTYPIIHHYDFLDSTYYQTCLNYYDYSWNKREIVLYNSPDMYDMLGVMKSVVTDTKELAAWYDSFKQLVPFCRIPSYWYSIYVTSHFIEVDAEQCGGISMYIPFSKYEEDSFYDFYNNIQWGQLKMFSVNQSSEM